MSKKIFIDGGTHMFQGFEEFAAKFNIDGEWECYSFEANPSTYEESKDIHEYLLEKGFRIDHRNQALSDFDGVVKVNCSQASPRLTPTGQGSNILENPPLTDDVWGVTLNYTSTVTEVKSINLAEFIKSICSEGDYLLIKLDVEGSEFMILDSLIKDINIKLISDIYVEFHERFFEDQDLYIAKKAGYKKAFEDKGIILNEWK